MYVFLTVQLVCMDKYVREYTNACNTIRTYHLYVCYSTCLYLRMHVRTYINFVIKAHIHMYASTMYIYTFIHEHIRYMIRIYENMHIRMYARTKAQTSILIF